MRRHGRPLTAENLPECDLVLVAIRPGAAGVWVRQNAPPSPSAPFLVDLCGVKRTVVEAITPIAEEYGFAYIGGHPMAGREQGGFTAATDDLYVGASMILTPDARTDMQLLETLKAFFWTSALQASPSPRRKNMTASSPSLPSWLTSPPVPMSSRRRPEAPGLLRRQLSGI